MAADAGGDDGDGDRRDDEDPMRRRGTGEPTPESEDEDENEEDVEETETPEYMVRMKRRSGWLTQGGKEIGPGRGSRQPGNFKNCGGRKGTRFSSGRKEEGRAPGRRALEAQCYTA